MTAAPRRRRERPVPPVRSPSASAEGRRALAAGDQRRAATLLAEALDLWRGAALADVGDVPFARGQALRLEELRVSAVEDRAEAELALGGHPTLVAELERLVAAHPLQVCARSAANKAAKPRAELGFLRGVGRGARR